MTKLILCSGKRATTPYHFKLTGVNIYSIEELCYYIYQNIYMMDEEIFTIELADFIENELGLTERAAKLKELIRCRAGLKDYVVCIFCSCDYYTEYEIKSLFPVIDEICDLPQVMRNKLLADQCLSYKNYVQAKQMYEAILSSQEAQNFDDKTIGNILHNMAIVVLHLSGFEEASKLFLLAYEHNHNIDTLHQYLLAVKLGSNEETYREALLQYTNGRAMNHIIQEEIGNIEEKIDTDKDYKVIKAIEQLNREGRVKLYRREVDLLLANWKDAYRKQNALQEG